MEVHHEEAFKVLSERNLVEENDKDVISVINYFNQSMPNDKSRK